MILMKIMIRINQSMNLMFVWQRYHQLCSQKSFISFFSWEKKPECPFPKTTEVDILWTQSGSRSTKQFCSIRLRSIADLKWGILDSLIVFVIVSGNPLYFREDKASLINKYKFSRVNRINKFKVSSISSIFLNLEYFIWKWI